MWGIRVPAFTFLEKYRGVVQHGNKIRELISAKPIIYEGQEIHRTMSFWSSAYLEETNIEKPWIKPPKGFTAHKI
jgi:hypothetical protein